MKKFTLMLVAMLMAFAANAWTVYFQNPDNWEEVYVYTYGGDGETCGAWPGKAMSKSGDVWKYEGTGTSANIIFNNNKGAQTGNFPFEDGATYDMNGVVGAEVKTYSIFFENKAGWDKVCVYGWDGIKTKAWPGDELTKNDDGIYVFTIEAGFEPSGKIKFNGGGDNPQTGEFVWETGKTYTNGTDTPDPNPGNFDGWYVHLAGSFNDWDDFNNGVNPDSDGVVTFDNVKLGDGWFKIHTWNGTAGAWYSANGTIKLGEEVEFHQVNPTSVHEEATTLEGYSADNTYNVVYNCATNMIKVTSLGDPTGVAAVEAANGEAVYFNMQGVRVANPENGLFIRVQNGKAVKVVK